MTTTSTRPTPASPAQTRRPVVQWTAAMALSGTIGAVVVQSGADAPAAAFARCLVGGLLLIIWSSGRGWLLPQLRTLSARDLAMIVGGGVLLVANWVLLFASYEQSSIAVGTVVYHTQPLLLVGLAAIVLRERITRSHLSRALIAFGGVAAISLGATGTDGQPIRPAGILLALGAALLYAGATLIAKQLSHLRPHVVAAIQLSVGAVLLAPALLFTPLPTTASGLAWLLLLGSVHTAVMYVLMYSSVGKLPTGTVAVLSYVYPVVAVIVDVAAFGHQITLVEAAGMTAVLAAAIAPRRR